MGAEKRKGNGVNMALPYQQPVPGIPQRQPPPAQPPRPQSQTYTRNDFESSTPRTVYQAPKQAPSGPGAPKPPAPTTDYLRNPTPATTGALQMQAYAPPQRTQVNYGQAGNAANSAQGRAPAFTSTMTDPFGQPTTPQQFYPQQDAFVSQLLGQMGQIPSGTWLGQGAPPPDFGRRPQMDFGQMWGNAGQMVDQGFTNPFSPGMAAPIQPPPQGTPYQPGFGGGLPDAAPISFMRPTAGPVQPAPSLYMPNYSREPAWITRPGMPEYPPIPDTPFMDPRLQSVVDQRTAREDRLRRQGWRDRPVGPGFAQPIPEPPAGDPYPRLTREQRDLEYQRARPWLPPGFAWASQY